MRPQIVGVKMIQSRRAIVSAFISLSLAWPLSVARADQLFQRFLPLLIDIEGWQAEKPKGVSMHTSDLNMTTASRDYQRGKAELHAGVVIGPTAEATLGPLEEGMNVQTTAGHVVSGTMHGMQVLRTFYQEQKSGVLIVGLTKDALFNLSYVGVTEDEAVALAEKFDWKAIQSAAQAK